VIGLGLAGDGLRRCGDNTRQGSEACDGDDFGGETCATQGFALGTLRCASGCFIDTSGCFATRYVDNGDGTVTDTKTNLMWEKKTGTVGTANLADVHDVNNAYSWSASGSDPDGTLYTDFLPKLNDTTCFAGYCDWRVPKAGELRSIELAEYPNPCSARPCIDSAFGATNPGYYWASSMWQQVGSLAWFVSFDGGLVGGYAKTFTASARAVRGGR